MFDFFKILIDARRAKMEERGASAVEYALLIAGIAALIVAVVFLFSDVIINLFDKTCDSVAKTTSGC